MVLKISRPKVPTTGTLLTNAASVSPTWRIPNRPDTREFEPQYSPDPTLELDCSIFELTHEGAAHWMAMDRWTLDEAALLLAGANPLHIRTFDADPNIYKPDFTTCGHLGLKMRLQRAHETGVLVFPCLPLRVIEWAKSKHAIPTPFEALLPVPVVTTATTVTAGTPSEQDTATPAPVVAVGALVEPDKAGPLPVATRAMADSFAGLRWNGEEWIKKLGNKTVWLNACLGRVINQIH